MAHFSHVLPVEHIELCVVAVCDVGVLMYSKAESLLVCRGLEALGGRSAGELFIVVTKKPARMEGS